MSRLCVVKAALGSRLPLGTTIGSYHLVPGAAFTAQIRDVDHYLATVQVADRDRCKFADATVS